VVARKAGERLAVCALRGAQSPAVEVKVAELDERPRLVLPLAGAGPDGELHRGDRRGGSAEELARVRDARVRGQARLACGHPVEGGESLVVAAELDERVAEDSVDGCEAGGQPARALG
jgi:hypothetical protein